MSKKNKKKKKRVIIPKERNPVALIARMRNSSGPMKSKNKRRRNKNSWRDEEMIDVE